MMTTMHTTSTENVFRASCSVGQCDRTAAVHQRRRGGLDGFGTMVTWLGPSRPDHVCWVDQTILDANESMLRQRAADADAEAGRVSSWNFTETPEVRVLHPAI